MRCSRTFLVFLSILSFAGEALAGSWIAPSDIVVLSPNGRHQVTVHAAGKNLKGRIVVESKIGGLWKQRWEATVVNEVMPQKVTLNRTGSQVITLGNWYGKETGNDSLVVYSEGSVLAQYSLAALTMPKIPSSRDGAEGAWLMDSHYGFDKNLGFYLWLDFARKWSVIDLDNGQLRKLTPEIIVRCENLARTSLLQRINSGKRSFSDLKILSRFMRPEDKKIFEPLLTHPGEHIGCGTRHQGNKSSADYGLIEYFQANRYRGLAENALDALAKGDSDAGYRFLKKDHYKRLGTLQLIAKFDQLPKKEDGVIVVWLEPINDMGVALAKKRPVHAIAIDLRWKNPERYGINPKAPQNTVPMNFYGVTPGRYQLCGFWSKEVKSSIEIDKDFWTRTGEQRVRKGATVELKKSEVSKATIVFEPLKAK